MSKTRDWRFIINNLTLVFSRGCRHAERAFTIVELLVVIIVIGILATIVVLSYNSVMDRASESAVQADVNSTGALMDSYLRRHHEYPQDPKAANENKDLPSSGGNTVTYNVSDSHRDYCVSVTDGNVTYHRSSVDGNKTLVGDCSGITFPVSPSPFIQTVTTANCPATMTRVQDARDSHTYWIQKVGSLCWMMTNLAYAGDGINTYGDVMPTGDGSGGTLNGPDNAGAAIYTLAKYYIPTGSNATTEPTDPSISTNGTGQYGYLYNWCAAMRGQATAACQNTTTPTPVTTTTICPANWRLPVGNNAEMKTLNDTVNSGSTSSDSGLIGAGWLGQRSGTWNGGFGSQGTNGFYWSSSLNSTNSAYSLYFLSTNVSPANYSSKFYGFAVRCVAAV